MSPWLLGFVLAVLITCLAYRVRALSLSGCVAALVLGTLVFSLGGWGWAVLLVAFFLTSSGLSHLFKRKKADLVSVFSKGGRRDALQVLANGGVAGLCVIMHAITPAESWPWVAFAGALAAVTADTWATELGVLSRVPPRLITNGRTVQRGTSGAVSLTGTLAAGGGALLIGLLAVLLQPGGSLVLVAVVMLAGLSGSLVDSLLGATMQAIYFCPMCYKETEIHPLHGCGERTSLVRGWRWMSNDLVNFFCALTGAIMAVGLAELLLPVLIK